MSRAPLGSGETAPPLLVIAGATATGKSGLAIRTAVRLIREGVPAEVISADSRQVFRGLDIGTAKVPVAERGGVPHHGLDLVDPDEAFSVAAFATHARQALDAIAQRHGLAILAGGTGLYLRSIARGIDTDALPSDAAVRARLEGELNEQGPAALAARLRRVDPDRAARIDLDNPRRVVRALEIAEISGSMTLPPPHGYPGRIAWLGLALESATHRAWIASRARGQFEAGLIDEAEALRRRYDPSLPAFSAIGYREAWAVLDSRLDREAAIAEDVRRNIGFAKRQRTWFRPEPGIVWLDATDADGAALNAAHRLLDPAAP